MIVPKVANFIAVLGASGRVWWSHVAVCGIFSSCSLSPGQCEEEGAWCNVIMALEGKWEKSEWEHLKWRRNIGGQLRLLINVSLCLKALLCWIRQAWIRGVAYFYYLVLFCRRCPKRHRSRSAFGALCNLSFQPSFPLLLLVFISPPHGTGRG
jgi:hypothetical protein